MYACIGMWGTPGNYMPRVTFRLLGKVGVCQYSVTGKIWPREKADYEAGKPEARHTTGSLVYNTHTYLYHPHISLE